MDYGGMDHGDMDMGGQCSMNACIDMLFYSLFTDRKQMLFTWSSKDLCIIFRQWRVTGILSLILSLVAIVLLTAGYECIREISRRYEQQHSAEMAAYSTSGSSMFRLPTSCHRRI
jgi:copper transporter 1